VCFSIFVQLSLAVLKLFFKWCVPCTRVPDSRRRKKMRKPTLFCREGDNSFFNCARTLCPLHLTKGVLSLFLSYTCSMHVLFISRLQINFSPAAPTTRPCSKHQHLVRVGMGKMWFPWDSPKACGRRPFDVDLPLRCVLICMWVETHASLCVRASRGKTHYCYYER
jgi:hypothetical protein